LADKQTKEVLQAHMQRSRETEALNVTLMERYRQTEKLDRETDILVDSQTYEKRETEILGIVHGHKDRQMTVRTDRLTDGQTYGQ
jgi:hypothetical protein